MAIELIIKMIREEQDANRIDKDRLLVIIEKLAEEVGANLSGGAKGSSVAGPRGPPGPVGPAGPAGPPGVCQCASEKSSASTPAKKTAAKKTTAAKKASE